MALNNPRVRIRLESFYKKDVWVLIDLQKSKTIKDLKQVLSAQLSIPEHFDMFLENGLIGDNQLVLILRENDLITIKSKTTNGLKDLTVIKDKNSTKHLNHTNKPIVKHRKNENKKALVVKSKSVSINANELNKSLSNGTSVDWVDYQNEPKLNPSLVLRKLVLNLGSKKTKNTKVAKKLNNKSNKNGISKRSPKIPQKFEDFVSDVI